MTGQELLAIAKPILFNTEMVGAIQNNKKMVTRRVVKQKSIDDILSSPARLENPNIPDEKFIECLCNAPYAVGDYLYVRETWNSDWCDHTIYKADGGSAKSAGYAKEPRWCPSIHMPKEAARLFLRITNVRVERLQDYGNSQAKDEGCTCCSQFARLWDSTIKKSDLPRYGWKANPWVWVIEFERVEV